MIKAIFVFNNEYQLLLKKEYTKEFDFERIAKELQEEPDFNFIEFEDSVLVCRRFDDTSVCFIVEDENEMYIFSLITLLMCAIERTIGNLNHKSFVYYFKEISHAIDNFILNGKVITLEIEEIAASMNEK
ncbi:AP-2 complex subunit sigma [Glugoides intestinalis]